MKCTVATKDFAAAVGAASKVVNTHTTVPILSNVLLEARDGKISVRATDLEMTLEHAVEAEVKEPGAVTVPARLLADYLANLPAGMVELGGTPARANLKMGRSTCDFNALPPEEFPPLPSAGSAERYAIDAKRLRDGITATVFCASTEEARGAVLMGTLFEFDERVLTMVATDGYRLGRWRSALAGTYAPAKYIVPSRALKEVARNLGTISGEVHVEVLGTQANQLRFSAGNVAVTVRLVDGQYPNYAQVIPSAFDRTVTAKTSDLIAALRRVELVAGDRANLVKLEIANQSLIMTAGSDIAGSAYEELEIEQQGEPLSIAFNAEYLVDILTHIPTEHVRLQFVGPLSPASITPVEASDVEQQYVLMPLRQ